jgi:precorrin-6A/cobalt-precorrin-6A reductase
MKILILGGTSDARKIASQLIAQSVDVVYSVAGLVRLPDLDCEVISGGFSQYQRTEEIAGLDSYLLDNDIHAVLDATHPYAINMTSQAQQSCSRLKLSYWRFNRPAWQQQKNDKWQIVEDWQQLINCCAVFKRPMLTTGQISQQHLDLIAQNSEQVVYRTAAPSKAGLAANVKWLKARGPFDYAAEHSQLKALDIDVLVTKNAGGEATYQKLVAARALNIDVIMLDRPKTKHKIGIAANLLHQEFATILELLTYVTSVNNKN